MHYKKVYLFMAKGFERNKTLTWIFQPENNGLSILGEPNFS